ncbi:acyl-CoA thioester hydrolase/BAAT C-terminal domain-containing protein [Pontibacter sp. G13]|uniref:acyl-CoA thioester hydrolase/BAAT C-terminal domain-containing protein n=1 Tax=Pontibacter sp. G13 TaxID=3074898 RepID=UPI0028896F8E|nr:acyl-CoA thioester hydrolase/BAAT C-terminal domain-containing protein [Pontibacter sp. G13]WNJ19872.1 acyl-CoA thioester hydrolase/BAAT C-terminal domain-containing protein [Pontibacter sp. G13]
MNKSTRILLGCIVVIALLVVGYRYLDNLLFDGIRPTPIHEQEFQASFFAKSDIEHRPAVVVIGGGAWGDYWAQELAKANYVGLSLPYCCQDELPSLPEEIPLEYFQDAVHWLKQQPEVNPDQIVVMGASRNAELALVIASYLPESIHGAIAFCPSSVSWSNTVLPYNSDAVKPSWTLDNEPIPFIPMDKYQGGESDTLETLSYWTEALQDSQAVNFAAIPVENIQGPILLFSGLDDQVWPSFMMSEMIEERLNAHNFGFSIDNIQYLQAGHLISGNPNHLMHTRYGSMQIGGKTYAHPFGGTAEGDQGAQQDAHHRVMGYFAKLSNE